jgi:hypothetical protein
MATYKATSASYDFTSDYAQGIEVVYSYIETDPYVEYQTVAYSYTDGLTGTENIVGCRAAATQEIMNNLPEWMSMRQLHDSVGQQLTHAWGHNLEEANAQFSEYRKEQFLDTANEVFDLHGSVSELSFNEEKVYTADTRNLLFNSSFSMLSTARLQKPEGWSVRRNSLDDLQMVNTNVVFGSYAVRLANSVELKQTRELHVGGGKLSLSIYAQTLLDTGLSTTARYEATEAGMILVLHYANGDVKSLGVGFLKNTQGAWSRIGMSVTLTGELNSYEVIIVNRTSNAMIVDLPMLEGAGSIRPWTPSFEDVPIYLTTPFKSVTAVQIVSQTLDNAEPKRIELFEASSENEFSDLQVPTRMTPFYPHEDQSPTVSSALGRQVNFFEEVHPVQWVIFNGKILEKSLTKNDHFGTVKPRDLYMDEAGDLYLDMTLSDSDLTVKAVTVLGKYLFAVTEETYAGKTAHYLKVIKPDKIRYEDTYLESISDLLIPINLNTFGSNAQSEDIERIGICRATPGIIFIDTTLDRRFYFKLQYDYYYADFGVRKLFCRESYLDSNAHLQVI